MIIWAYDFAEAILELSIPADDLVISPTDIFGITFRGSLTKFINAFILQGDSYHVSNFLLLVRESKPPFV